jgi:mRNA-degrading endonuclease RelE of RelBE toxin-antitoxin system
MTLVGAGGVVIDSLDYKASFKRKFKKITPDLQQKCMDKIETLKNKPIPPGTRFEKLSGYSNPNIYTLHITGNYKVSFEIEGTTAILRSVGTHNLIDRAP